MCKGFWRIVEHSEGALSKLLFAWQVCMICLSVTSRPLQALRKVTQWLVLLASLCQCVQMSGLRGGQSRATTLLRTTTNETCTVITFESAHSFILEKYYYYYYKLWQQHRGEIIALTQFNTWRRYIMRKIYNYQLLTYSGAGASTCSCWRLPPSLFCSSRLPTWRNLWCPSCG